MKYSGKKDGVKYISDLDEKNIAEIEEKYEEAINKENEEETFSSGPEDSQKSRGKKVLNIMGKVFFGIQAVLSVSLIVLLVISGLLPTGIVIAIAAGLLVLLAFVFYTQFLAGKLIKKERKKIHKKDADDEDVSEELTYDPLDDSDKSENLPEESEEWSEDQPDDEEDYEGAEDEGAETGEKTGKKGFFSERGSKLRLIGMIISIVLCIAIAIADYYVYITINLLNTISTTAVSVQLYDVVVLADDSAEELADITEYTLGTYSSFSSDDLEYVLEYIYEETGAVPGTSDYSSVFEQAAALYAGEVQAIVYDDSFSEMIEDAYEDYENETKIIAQIRVETEEEENLAVDVDVVSDPFIVLISGNDQYGEISSKGRSDVNMLAVVNPGTAQILLVSIPRDYYIELAGIDTDMRDKLTHAGIYGISTLQQTIENTFDIEINYYVQVNFTSLIEIVDAVGGITVYNEYAFSSHKTDDYYAEGWIELTGDNVLWFARERNNLVNGDFDRIKHHQQIISGIIDKLVSASSIVYYTAIVDALEDSAVTNMSQSKISDLVQFQISSGTEWEVFSAQAAGESMRKACYSASGQSLSVVMPYAESIADINELVNRVLNGEIITEEDADLSYSSGTYITDVTSGTSDSSTDSSSDTSSDSEAEVQETQEETTAESFYLNTNSDSSSDSSSEMETEAETETTAEVTTAAETETTAEAETEAETTTAAAETETATEAATEEETTTEAAETETTTEAETEAETTTAAAETETTTEAATEAETTTAAAETETTTEAATEAETTTAAAETEAETVQ